MSSVHCHNPYIQALPTSYQTLPTTFPSVPHTQQQQNGYQQQPQQGTYFTPPSDIQLHQKPYSSNGYSSNGGAQFASYGAKYGYHGNSNNSYQSQYHAQQQRHDEQAYSCYQTPAVCAVECAHELGNQTGCTPPAMTGALACFPGAVMDQLLDGPNGAKEDRGDGHDNDDCPTIASCLTPPSIPDHGQHGSLPPMYTNFVGAPMQQGTPSEGTPIGVHGVVKTTEAVVRNELNGRVPYLHFPPMEEMQRIVKVAKDAMETLDTERLAANPDLPVTPDGRLKKSYMPVFFGQVPFSTTQHHLTWLLLHVTGLVPSAVSNHSPGCFTCYFANLDECNAVLSLNKRMLFDTNGVWAAQDPYQTDLVFTSANFWRQKQQQQQMDEANGITTGEQIPRLPRGAMVVELPVHNGGGRNNGNHNRGASRMR